MVFCARQRIAFIYRDSCIHFSIIAFSIRLMNKSATSCCCRYGFISCTVFQYLFVLSSDCTTLLCIIPEPEYDRSLAKSAWVTAPANSRESFPFVFISAALYSAVIPAAFIFSFSSRTVSSVFLDRITGSILAIMAFSLAQKPGFPHFAV